MARSAGPPRAADELASNRRPRDALSGRVTRRQNGNTEERASVNIRRYTPHRTDSGPSAGAHQQGRRAAVDRTAGVRRHRSGRACAVKSIHALPTCSRAAWLVAEDSGWRRSRVRPGPVGPATASRNASRRCNRASGRGLYVPTLLVSPRSTRQVAGIPPAGMRGPARTPASFAPRFVTPAVDSSLYAASRRRNAPRPRRAAFSAPRTVSPTRWPASWCV